MNWNIFLLFFNISGYPLFLLAPRPITLLRSAAMHFRRRVYRCWSSLSCERTQHFHEVLREMFLLDSWSQELSWYFKPDEQTVVSLQLSYRYLSRRVPKDRSSALLFLRFPLLVSVNIFSDLRPWRRWSPFILHGKAQYKSPNLPEILHKAYDADDRDVL